MKSFTQEQHAMLMELAENPVTAPKLVKKLDASPWMANILWDVYCIAHLTMSA